MLSLILLGQSNLVEHDLSYVSTKKLNSVSVAGSFNSWNKDTNPLIASEEGRRWSIRLRLKPGTYTYKLVLDGNMWITDPNAIRNEDDGHGNTNSLLEVSPSDYKLAAKLNDGIITRSALFHLSEVPFVNFDRGHLTLSLQARPEDISSIQVTIKGVGTFPLSDMGGDEFFERYSVSIPWSRKTDLHYRFVLDDGQGPMSFGPHGLTSTAVSNDFMLKASSYQPFFVPEWVERSVIYQIFPDRFANGDTRNDPPNVERWDGKPSYYNFFGGDIAGVQQHLGYLKGLGVSAIFFNPVFKSPANHRYETTDYFQIDPIFGTNEEFVKLTHDLKRNGMRTILDGVFNHTSTRFAPFADVVKNGVQSNYNQWYKFRSFPVQVGRQPNYETWGNSSWMPKLNYSTPEVRKYMLSIPQYWQKLAGIDGWRLDAGNEVEQIYWKEFRKKVKSANPNAWIVGEVWGDGSPWLKGDQWDSVMNYPFRNAVLGFVTKGGSGKPSDLIRLLMATYNGYAPQVSRNLMNLIGSHDTPRILTVCGGDHSLAKLAAILQFTWVGAPNVYYGDELGLEGDRDPDNRRPMPWTTATPSNDFLTLYKKLIRIRNSNRALQSGDPIPMVSDDAKQVLCFARVLDDKADIIAINRADREEEIDLRLNQVAGLPRSAVTVEFTDALSGNEYIPSKSTLHLRLSPRSAVVLIPRSGSLIHSRHLSNAHLGVSLATSKALAHKELP